jgi:hypothetical protein
MGQALSLDEAVEYAQRARRVTNRAALAAVVTKAAR